MSLNFIRCLFLLLFISAKSIAQVSTFPGIWQMEYLTDSGTAPIQMELQIASPENHLLYPAILKLSCDSFTAAYELLLVKKNSRELGISKNKQPLFETPFSLRKADLFLNGIFDNSKDLKGQSTLTISRMQSKHPFIYVPDTLLPTKAQQATALRLARFLKEAEITFTKVNDQPWKSDDINGIISPSLSPAYFGLLDTIFLPTRDGILHITGTKKTDIVTVALNGQINSDRIAISKKAITEDILLDTGLNLLVLFADNFGDDIPNKGKLNLEFANKKFNLDFSRKADSAATFIIAPMYCEKDKGRGSYFREYYPTGNTIKPLKENEKLLGSIVATAKQLKLAIWDDAVEDGDSISININGKWIEKGLPVKKKPQFISITLQPGPNTITFVGDNLGSIPPNTSVLEIIDGKKRKSFMLATVPGENNLINIFYDLKPE